MNSINDDKTISNYVAVFILEIGWIDTKNVVSYINEGSPSPLQKYLLVSELSRASLSGTYDDEAYK